MDCKKVQRLISDFGDGRLSSAAAQEVHRHVSDCSDCRVRQQRALRLQQLLAVKRHETPGAHYFDNFETQFQKRLARETTPRPTLWRRFCERLHIQPVWTMRYGFAHALGVMFAVAVVWRGISATDLPVASGLSTNLDFSAPHLISSSLPASRSTPRIIASVLPLRSVPAVSPSAALVIPDAVRADFSAPGYVLDEFTATPAYEVASIHF